MSKLSIAPILVLVGLVCSPVSTVPCKSASADQPDGVVRTFIVFLAGNVTVDFLHEDSVMVKAEMTNNHDPIEFVDLNNPDLSEFNFDASDWVTGNAMYITKGEGRTKIGPFAWLVDEMTPEPPPVGSHTLMGPDTYLEQETVNYFRCSSSNCDSNDTGKFKLSVNPANPRLIVVTAVFSR
jgi:hypothetical protein